MDVAGEPRLEDAAVPLPQHPHLRTELLGRPPALRAAARLRLRDADATGEDAALAHVADLEDATLEQDVGRLEVAVHDLVRVQVLDAVEQLLRRPLPRLRRRQLRHPHRQVARRQGAAWQGRVVAELHVNVDEVGVLVLAVVVHDVRVAALVGVLRAAQRRHLLVHEVGLDGVHALDRVAVLAVELAAEDVAEGPAAQPVALPVEPAAQQRWGSNRRRQQRVAQGEHRLGSGW